MRMMKKERRKKRQKKGKRKLKKFNEPKTFCQFSLLPPSVGIILLYLNVAEPNKLSFAYCTREFNKKFKTLDHSN